MKALCGGRWRVGEHLIPQALVQMLWALPHGHEALWNMPLHFFLYLITSILILSMPHAKF